MSNTAVLLDALAQKASRIERCVVRVHEEFVAASDFLNDYSHQDAAILNIQRACELAIDMGNMVVSHEGWGLPGGAREVFAVLHTHGVLSAEQTQSLQKMVGFRNMAVHDYDSINMGIVVKIIQSELNVVLRFAGLILSRYQRKSLWD
jgi:uncharacterized protein YutE (UPF0331/DUF86 family)